MSPDIVFCFRVILKAYLSKKGGNSLILGFHAGCCFFVFFFACRAFLFCIQFLAAGAHQADLFGGVADHQGMVGDIFGHDGAGADEGVLTDGIAADNGAIGTECRALLNKCWPYLIHFTDFRPWIIDVGKDHGGSAKNAVFQRYAFIDADIVLNFALVADFGVGTDNNVLADVAVVADFGAGKDVGEVPHLCAFADGNVVVDYG